LASASRQPPRVSPDPHETAEVTREQTARDREARELGREEVMASQRDGDNTDPQRRRAERPENVSGQGGNPGAPAGDSHEERLEPLFAAEQADGYRNRWIAIQSSFVDDPSAAVRAGDELVAQVMSELASSFAGQRDRIESQLSNSGPENTEDLRVALRSYRSFFERLLSL